MTADELLDCLATVAGQCGRGEAYDIRRAAGVNEDGYGGSEEEATLRAFIAKTLKG